MRNILLTIICIIYIGTSFAQNSLTNNKVNSILHYQNLSQTVLNPSHGSYISKNARSGFFDWKERWNEHSTRKIIVGSVCILLGAEGMVETFLPNTNHENPSSRRIRQIEMASISTMLLASGTVLLIRGIHLKRQNKIQLTTSANGIGLIYSI